MCNTSPLNIFCNTEALTFSETNPSSFEFWFGVIVFPLFIVPLNEVLETSADLPRWVNKHARGFAVLLR